MIRNVMKWSVLSMREKGIVPTVKLTGAFTMDLLFDWKYGTDTMRWVEKEDLGPESEPESFQHSYCYKATRARPFRRLLKELDLPKDSNFIDIGAGKGRALLLASHYGFRKVIGVEFSPELCAVARKNVASYARKVNLKTPIEIVQADATKQAFGPEDGVFYLFNPFDAVLLEKFLSNIKQSLAKHPRRAWLIYGDPQHHDVIKQSGLFKSDSMYRLGGSVYRVYKG